MRCPKCKSKAVASATRFIEYNNSQEESELVSVVLSLQLTKELNLKHKT